MEKRMLYSTYKKHYADCANAGDYDAATKTITVAIPDGREKASGTRGERYRYYHFNGLRPDGTRATVCIKAVSVANAVKSLTANYDKSIQWDIT